MVDPLRKVKAGDGPDRLLEASTFNAFIDAAQFIRDRFRGKVGAGEQKTDPLVPASFVYARPATTLPSRSVVSPTAAVISPATAPIQAQDHPVFTVAAPAAETDPIFITIEPAGSGEIAQAVALGVAVVKVNVTDAAHEFAVPIAGDTTKLVSAVSGPVRILAPLGTGESNRLVLLTGGGAGSGGGGGLDCEPHGWLDDEEALEDAADPVNGNDPIRVLRYWVLAGVPGGRCECILEQWTPASAFYPGVAQALFDGSGHSWTGTRPIHTCMGCGIPTFVIPGNTSTAFPKITGTLTLNGGDTYDLKYHCAGRNPNQVVMAMSGPKVCNSNPSPIPCENVAYIVVECDDCEMETVECDQCIEICGDVRSATEIIRVPATGFTNDKEPYNGIWPLEYTGDCEWELTCGDVTVNLTKTPTGPNDTTVITLTFSGASGSGGGSVTYLYTSPEIISGVGTNVSCFTSNTLTRDDSGGVVPDAPPTVAIEPIFCEQCPELCGLIDFENMAAGVVSFTGNCDVALTLSSFVAGASATFALDGPDNDVQLHVRCAGGRLRVDISGSATQAFAEVSLVVTDSVFEWTVDVTFAGDPNDPCGGSFRVIFSSPILP